MTKKNEIKILLFPFWIIAKIAECIIFWHDKAPLTGAAVLLVAFLLFLQLTHYFMSCHLPIAVWPAIFFAFSGIVSFFLSLGLFLRGIQKLWKMAWS